MFNLMCMFLKPTCLYYIDHIYIYTYIHIYTMYIYIHIDTHLYGAYLYTMCSVYIYNVYIYIVYYIYIKYKRYCILLYISDVLVSLALGMKPLVNLHHEISTSTASQNPSVATTTTPRSIQLWF